MAELRQLGGALGRPTPAAVRCRTSTARFAGSSSPSPRRRAGPLGRQDAERLAAAPRRPGRADGPSSTSPRSAPTPAPPTADQPGSGSVRCAAQVDPKLFVANHPIGCRSSARRSLRCSRGAARHPPRHDDRADEQRGADQQRGDDDLGASPRRGARGGVPHRARHDADGGADEEVAPRTRRSRRRRPVDDRERQTGSPGHDHRGDTLLAHDLLGLRCGGQSARRPPPPARSGGRWRSPRGSRASRRPRRSAMPPARPKSAPATPDSGPDTRPAEFTPTSAA